MCGPIARLSLHSLVHLRHDGAFAVGTLNLQRMFGDCFYYRLRSDRYATRIPGILVFCMLRAVPCYAAYAGNRMYDQLTHELRSIFFNSFPSDMGTMPTSISPKIHAASNVTAPILEVFESIMQRLDRQQNNKNWDVGAAALAVLGTAAVVLAKKW